MYIYRKQCNVGKLIRQLPLEIVKFKHQMKRINEPTTSCLTVKARPLLTDISDQMKRMLSLQKGFCVFLTLQRLTPSCEGCVPGSPFSVQQALTFLLFLFEQDPVLHCV